MEAKNIFLHWLNYLDVPHTSSFTEEIYQKHPYKYTLYGLSKLLALYKIDNDCVRLEDKSTIHELPPPFLANLADDFVIVKSIDHGKISYDWYGHDIVMSEPDFIQGWSGVVLLAYPNKHSIEPDYNKHKKEELERKGIIALIWITFLTLFLCSFLIRDNINFTDLLLSVFEAATNLGGLYITYLLLLKQLHIDSSVADRICNSMKKSSCNNVLESNASKLLGRFGWSEVGTAYFSVNLCALALSPQSLPYLMFFSFGSLFYVVWSIWYQHFKAHTWCPLCLIIQGIFVLQATGYAITYLFTSIAAEFQILYCILLLSGYALVLFTLNLLLPTFVSEQKMRQLTFNFNNLKAQEKVFNAIQSDQKIFPTENVSSLIFGPEDACMTITVFSNPYCNPCAAMHKRLEALLKKSCRIQYVLTYFGEEWSDINKYFIAACHTLGTDRTWNLLTDWFEGGKSRQEKFFAPLELDITSKDVTKEFEKHKAWRDKTKFDATPTVLVNDQELAYPYQLEDLLMFAV